MELGLFGCDVLEEPFGYCNSKLARERHNFISGEGLRWSFLLMKDHPLSEIFPLMGAVELRELAVDIEKRGLEQAIVVYEGKILDGRNRYRACGMVEVDPIYEDYKGDDPRGFVLSQNLHRRHLTVGQRAALGAEQSTTTGPGGDHSVNLPNAISNSKAAEEMNVSEKSVRVARKIKKKSPNTFEKLKSGKMSLNEAKNKVMPARTPFAAYGVPVRSVAAQKIGELSAEVYRLLMVEKGKGDQQYWDGLAAMREELRNKLQNV